MRRNLLVAIIFAVALVSFCRREERTETTTIGDTGATVVTTAADTATVATTAAEPATTATATTATAVAPVHVTLTEYRIEMPEILPAGRTTFHVMNSGQKKHGFEVEGEGFEKELEKELGPGENGTLEVDLRPGTYRVYCPVGNHAEKHGMTRQLTVQ